MEMTIGSPILTRDFIMFPSRKTLIVAELFFIITFTPFLGCKGNMGIMEKLCINSTLTLAAMHLRSV